MIHRSRKTTLLDLMEFLAAVHQDMSEADFDRTMNLGLDDRVSDLVRKAEEDGVEVSNTERDLLHAMYRGNKPFTSIRPILSPIRLTKR